MAFCIPKHLVDQFLKDIKSGKINPDKLMEMNSKQRNAFFTEMFGEASGKKVNALFESKLLLKSQQLGIINWAKKVGDLKPEAKRDLLSRVERMEEILTPETQEVFLKDLADQRLGVGVTMKEAGNISALAKDVKVKREAFENGGDQTEYGMAIEAFSKYTKDLKIAARALKPIEYIKPWNWWRLVEETAGFQKSLKSTLDLSASLRQGLPILFTQPKIWAKGFKISVTDAIKTLGGKDMEFIMNARTHVRENTLNGIYKRFKVDSGVTEEAFPTSLPARIPLFGRLFKASEVGFTSFLREVRLDTFDLLYKSFTDKGLPTEGLGKYVNSLTGRGDLGRLEPAGKFFNNVFFSVRFMKSSMDKVTGFQLNRNMSKSVRAQAMKDTAKIWGGVAATLAVADALIPGSVEWDPRSSDNGKIKVGNTRFDVSGGMSSVSTLVARVAPRVVGQPIKVKSSQTGIVTTLNDPRRYRGRYGSDLVGDFFGNKKSPFMTSLKIMLDNETYDGDPLTLGNFAFESLSPIILENAKELYDDPRSANIILALTADFFGIGTNTYGPEVDWLLKNTKEMVEWREKLIKKNGEEEGLKLFKERNKYYNDRYVPWLQGAIKNPVYQALSEDDKWQLLYDKRNELKKKTFTKYKFKPSKSRRKKLPVIK